MGYKLIGGILLALGALAVLFRKDEEEYVVYGEHGCDERTELIKTASLEDARSAAQLYVDEDAAVRSAYIYKDDLLQEEFGTF